MDSYYYDDSAFQILAAMLSSLFIFSIIFYVLLVIALWKIFDKAGIAGWKSLIPIYNIYCICKIAWGSGWLFLVYVIPVVNFIFGIITQYRLAKSFGKGIGFTLGLIFFPSIFLLVLGFGKSEYNELAPL